MTMLDGSDNLVPLQKAPKPKSSKLSANVKGLKFMQRQVDRVKAEQKSEATRSAACKNSAGLLIPLYSRCTKPRLIIRIGCCARYERQ